MGIISRYFMTEINLETTKSLSKCEAEWASNLITFCRLTSQGPVSLRGLQTNAQMTQCASESSVILIGFTCAKICGSRSERGGRDLFYVTTLGRLTKKAWLVQSPISNRGLRSGCKCTFQVQVTVMAPVSPACCSEELLLLCEISLQEIKVSPVGWHQASAFPFCQHSLGAGGPNFLGDYCFNSLIAKGKGTGVSVHYSHCCQTGYMKMISWSMWHLK